MTKITAPANHNLSEPSSSHKKQRDVHSTEKAAFATALASTPQSAANAKSISNEDVFKLVESQALFAISKIKVKKQKDDE